MGCSNKSKAFFLHLVWGDVKRVVVEIRKDFFFFCYLQLANKEYLCSNENVMWYNAEKMKKNPRLQRNGKNFMWNFQKKIKLIDINGTF